MVEKWRVDNTIREDVVRLIVLGQAWRFSGILLLRKQGSHGLPTEWLSCLYIEWFAYKSAICEEGL